MDAVEGGGIDASTDSAIKDASKDVIEEVIEDHAIVPMYGGSHPGGGPFDASAVQDAGAKTD